MISAVKKFMSSRKKDKEADNLYQWQALFIKSFKEISENERKEIRIFTGKLANEFLLQRNLKSWATLLKQVSLHEKIQLKDLLDKGADKAKQEGNTSGIAYTLLNVNVHAAILYPHDIALVVEEITTKIIDNNIVEYKSSVEKFNS